MSYDGVYADTEERVAGGGSLSLVEHITELLGLAKGDISGIWDTGHNLQVVMGSFWIQYTYRNILKLLK